MMAKAKIAFLLSILYIKSSVSKNYLKDSKILVVNVPFLPVPMFKFFIFNIENWLQIYLLVILLKQDQLEYPTLLKREHVISTGTIVPFFMWDCISSPNWDPCLFLSCLKRSPADKCT